MKYRKENVLRIFISLFFLFIFFPFHVDENEASCSLQTVDAIKKKTRWRGGEGRKENDIAKDAQLPIEHMEKKKRNFYWRMLFTFNFTQR